VTTAVLRDGPAKAERTIVLAPGAGANMRHAFLSGVARAWGECGFAVVRFDFPYMQTARGRGRPDRLPVLQQAFRDVVGEHTEGRVVLAGKSMGGRVATTIADELGAMGVVVFGYPFHPPTRPDQLRTAHLAALKTPTLILQGERDPFGTRDQVAGYELSRAMDICWLPDGDHSLQPRKRSGLTGEQHFATAIARSAEFVRGLT
jgi:predicted alpha/beta-hydrolase family hydrolase